MHAGCCPGIMPHAIALGTDATTGMRKFLAELGLPSAGSGPHAPAPTEKKNLPYGAPDGHPCRCYVSCYQARNMLAPGNTVD